MERGQFDNRRYWGIYIYEVRQLHLIRYSLIDYIDYLIISFYTKYRFWKYWNLTMIHVMSLEVFFAYDMYLNVEEGDLKYTRKEENIVDFWTFRDLLSNHMTN